MEGNNSQILNDDEVHQIITKAIGDDKTWKLIKIEERRASDELAGFLGDHRRMTMYIDVDGITKNIYLFLKLMPTKDAEKASFIEGSQFFPREAVTLSLIEKIITPDPNPWCTIAYIRTEKMIVMPDLALQGYRNRTANDLDDLPHALLTAAVLARFHAAFANYETARKEEITFAEEYGEQLKEYLFTDNIMLRASIALHESILKTFSVKYSNLDVDLLPFYMDACKSVTNYDNTLNTLIHRDLWSNNVMFKYVSDIPINALLVDFQLVRYAPPAFDAMIFLYMSLNKPFRVKHQEELLKKYFDSFMEKATEDTKKRLKDLQYDWISFRKWCEVARKFALVCAMMICPFAFIDAVNAEKLTEGEDGHTMLSEDRSAPIIKYAKQYPGYKQRILDLFEEFVDLYVPNK